MASVPLSNSKLVGRFLFWTVSELDDIAAAAHAERVAPSSTVADCEWVRKTWASEDVEAATVWGSNVLDKPSLSPLRVQVTHSQQELDILVENGRFGQSRVTPLHKLTENVKMFCSTFLFPTIYAVKLGSYLHD